MGFQEDHRGEVPFSSHYTKGLCHEYNFKIIDHKVILPTSVCIMYSLKARYLAYPTGKGWEERSTSFRGVFNKLFGILLHWRFVYFPRFFYSIIYISLNSGIFIWVIVIIHYNSIYFMAYVPAWPFRTLPGWAQCPLDRLPLLCLCFDRGLPFFLALQGVFHAICLFLAPALESAILQGALIPFIEEWY